jgi:hypothetical protein
VSRDVHGNGNGGNTAVTAGNPRERERISRYYRGNGFDLHGYTAGTGTISSVIHWEWFQLIWWVSQSRSSPKSSSNKMLVILVDIEAIIWYIDFLNKW